MGLVPENGDYIQTFTGRAFYPLDPRIEDVDIRDIAHALSNLCRFNGHSKRFYSVAEHSSNMARTLRRRGASLEDQRLALLHDAAEAYLLDIPRPLKRLSIMAPYIEAELRIEATIAAALGLRTIAKSPLVEEYDTRILVDEAEALMRVDIIPWHLQHGKGLGVTIWALNAIQAEQQWITDAKKLELWR